jgi:hypothetical protein
VTDLDPKFFLAYWYGAAALPYDVGRDDWRNTRESTALLRKGLSVFPDDFRLNFLLAYNLQYYDRDYLAAAKLVRWLSERPGTPGYLSALATRLFAQAGDFDAGLVMAETLRDHASSAEERAFYERRVLEIHLERILQGVDKAVAAFRASEQRLPISVAELLASGFLSEYPVDPLGGRIEIDDKGQSHSSEVAHRLVLY